MSMHQKVSQRAKKQQEVWKHAEDVRWMLLPQKERGDRRKDVEAEPQWNAKTVSHGDSPDCPRKGGKSS
jgi:hypothetical protein